MGKHKEKKSKKHKKEKHRKNQRRSSEESQDEWVEKQAEQSSETSSLTPLATPKDRDEWMSLPTSFMSTSNVDRRQEREANKRLEKEREKYNPGQNVRELNPFWKDGGDGLPKFKKPLDDKVGESYKPSPNSSLRPSSNWRKKTETTSPQITLPRSETTSTSTNALAAKLIKAEIMGNAALVAELKEKLENARKIDDNSSEPELILTQTDSKGYSRPVKSYGEYSGGRSKKQKIETHDSGERMRYFPDDDNVSLQQMFENERYGTVDDSNREFMQLASKIRKNDDLDDVFTDNIRQKAPDAKLDKMNKDKAIGELRQTNEALDNCVSCLQSGKMHKHLLVSVNDSVYLSLPHYEPLTEGHCTLTPVRHVSCSTLLDENEWAEILNFRRAITKMFATKNEDVIFFETAMFLHRHPHMILHCVPVPKEQGDLAPIYFKKAIDDSEMEWATNKKLVSLAGRDVRRAIPKGLPYFAVSFGMDEGFAHVIEDQRLFPVNFAQEIIGGILDLHHSKWRKPKAQRFEDQKQRMLDFSNEWKKFDCTT